MYLFAQQVRGKMCSLRANGNYATNGSLICKHRTGTELTTTDEIKPRLSTPISYKSDYS